MAVRAGMTTLVSLLSTMVEAGNEFSEDELQTFLDMNKRITRYVILTAEFTRTDVSHVIYTDYFLPKNLGEWFELPIDGQVNDYFYLTDNIFAPILFGTGEDQAVYDNNIKRIRLGKDRFGIYLYLTAVSYDLYATAAFIWQLKLSSRTKLITVKTDNHSFDMQQEYDHCIERYNHFIGLASNKFSRFIRRDQGAGNERSYQHTQLHRVR